MKTLTTLVSLVLFSLTLNLSAQTETILHSFSNNGTDGYKPQAGLVLDSEGNLYGTTYYGGTNNTGAIYELPIAGGETILADCPVYGANGSLYPNSAIIFDASGNLYGTTAVGGLVETNYGGTDFKASRLPNGSFAIKRISGDLFGGEDEASTPAGLIFDSAGNLWGAALSGTLRVSGAVYELERNAGAWERFDRYDFPGTETTPPNPNPGLIFDAAGNLYGTTMTGGAGHKGTVYELTAQHYTFSSLFTFNGFDGDEPNAGVILDNSGNLYGSTTAGGAAGKGNIFELSPKQGGGWTEKVLFTFNGADGQAPGALTFDANGNLWGTTSLGGANGAGTVFELTNSAGTWTESVIHSFGGSGDGVTPVGALIFDSLGNVYGATSAGGADGVGTVWEITP